MIVTVTTASAVSSVTTLGFSVAILSIIAVIALVVFLCVKELATASGQRSYRWLSRCLDIGIVQLAIAFGMIVALEVMNII